MAFIMAWWHIFVWVSCLVCVSVSNEKITETTPHAAKQKNASFVYRYGYLIESAISVIIAIQPELNFSNSNYYSWVIMVCCFQSKSNDLEKVKIQFLPHRIEKANRKLAGLIESDKMFMSSGWKEKCDKISDSGGGGGREIREWVCQIDLSI